MIDVNIDKPLYGNFVYVRDKYIKLAKKLNQKLRITTPHGTRICAPDEWTKTAKRMEKKFKYPEPMVLWGNHVDIRPSSLSSKPQETTEGQLNLL